MGRWWFWCGCYICLSLIVWDFNQNYWLAEASFGGRNAFQILFSAGRRSNFVSWQLFCLVTVLSIVLFKGNNSKLFKGYFTTIIIAGDKRRVRVRLDAEPGRLGDSCRAGLGATGPSLYSPARSRQLLCVSCYYFYVIFCT